MSLREFFSKNATQSYDSIIDARGAEIVSALKTDLEIIKENMGVQGIKAIFARKTTGRYDEASGHLTYTLYKAESDHTHDYNARNKSMHAIKDAVQKAMRNSSALQDLHDYCADATVDMCVEENVNNSFEPNGFGSPYQNIDATIVIDTQMPYWRTLNRRAQQPPVPTAQPPAPVPAPAPTPTTAADKLRTHIEQLSEAEAAELLSALTAPAKPVRKEPIDRTIRAPRIPIQKRTNTRNT